MKTLYYRFLQHIKENSVMYPGTKPLVKRDYLTKGGIKNWRDLTLKDKLTLNIQITKGEI